MSVSILEALQSAEYNFNNAALPAQTAMAKVQLHNAIELLDKGYDVFDEVEPLLETYGSIENVPEKEVV